MALAEFEAPDFMPFAAGAAFVVAGTLVSSALDGFRQAREAQAIHATNEQWALAYEQLLHANGEWMQRAAMMQIELDDAHERIAELSAQLALALPAAA
jgi:hypothetical protein